jgi:DNA repair exonuclease SbcCD nuclease subunit
VRLIHTSDWHIGKVFSFAGDSVMSLLQRARLDAIDAIGKLAIAENARTVLVAGDVYDKPGPDVKTLAQPLEIMRRFPLVSWHLIPGNHDPDLPNGLWDRLLAIGLPDNVHLHRETTPFCLGGEAWVLPAPLKQKHHLIDPTAWMDQAPTPEGKKRIGLAHGSIAEFGSSSTTPNLIAPDRAKTAGLSYLALGDWHGAKSISAETWYSGTPETDAFGQQQSGQALMVDLSQGKPDVIVHSIGRFTWLDEIATLQTADDIRRLEARIRAIETDLSMVLLRLEIEGMLSLADHDLFEQTIAETGLAAALGLLDLDREQLIIRPSESELDALTGDPVVKDALRRLRTVSESEDHPDRHTATRAIRHLQLACYRRHHEAAA